MPILYDIVKQKKFAIAAFNRMLERDMCLDRNNKLLYMKIQVV